LGMDREDLGQELRIAIIKAADGFDESRGTKTLSLKYRTPSQQPDPSY